MGLIDCFLNPKKAEEVRLKYSEHRTGDGWCSDTSNIGHYKEKWNGRRTIVASYLLVVFG